MTRGALRSRLRRLERALALGRRDAEPAFPLLQWEQFCALIGEPSGATANVPPAPSVVLSDPALVRWMRRMVPDRLRELAEAQRQGRPTPKLKPKDERRLNELYEQHLTRRSVG